MDPLENALAVALIDHALTIKHCLSLYSRPAHQATQAELTRRLEEAFGPELATLATLPPMTPSRSSSRGLGTSHRSTPLGNGIRGAGHTAGSDGSGLVPRTARSSSRRHITKPSIGRISIVNPFRRVNHMATGSIATTWTGGRHRSGSKATTTRPSMERQRSHEYYEDDAVTVHSRTTSVSRTRSERRRSWFGGERATRTHQQHKASASVASEDIAGGDAEQRQHFYTRARSATSRSAKSGKSLDENSYARPGGYQQQSTHRPETKKSSTQALSDWGEGDTALPRTSNVNVDDRPAWEKPAVVHQPRPSEDYGQEPQAAAPSQMQMQSHSHSINVGAVRDTVMRRFSLLKGTVGRKTSRLHMRDAMGRGGITEVVREE